VKFWKKSFQPQIRDKKSLNIFSLFSQLKDGALASCQMHSKTCLISRSARAIAWEKSATGPEQRRPIKSTPTNISLNSARAVNIPTTMKRTRPPFIWWILLACRSHRISADASEAAILGKCLLIELLLRVKNLHVFSRIFYFAVVVEFAAAFKLAT
jgi:hypothetical protein